MRAQLELGSDLIDRPFLIGSLFLERLSASQSGHKFTARQMLLPFCGDVQFGTCRRVCRLSLLNLLNLSMKICFSEIHVWKQ